MKLPTEFIPLKDGTQICAPANITLMTPYILHEQGDWFEDEIHFVRKLIQPGMVCLDIGANYGLYSCAIASRLAGNGKLWCFEPAPTTAESLRETIKRNAYQGQIEVEECGLSDKQGTAVFYVSPNAELNSLEPQESPHTERVEIQLKTLDQFADERALSEVDFVKLDAEGEEVKILEGGRQFFERCQPLVMFELMHVEKVNKALLGAFIEIQYELFYLVPGLDVLARFDLSSGYDPYLLNLFAVPKAKVTFWSEEGIIVGVDKEIDKEIDNDQDESQGSSGLIVKHTKRANDLALDAPTRYASLQAAYAMVQDLDLEAASAPLLSSAARVAFSAGRREHGLRILEQYLKQLVPNHLPEVDEDYLPPLGIYDDKPLAERPEVNLCAVMVDAYLRLSHRSGYFTRTPKKQLFDLLRYFGALSKEMARREQVWLARENALRR